MKWLIRTGVVIAVALLLALFVLKRQSAEEPQVSLGPSARLPALLPVKVAMKAPASVPQVVAASAPVARGESVETSDDQASENAEKIRVLQEILSAKNDNDPRLDSEFRDLNPDLKMKLRAFYKGLKPEALNSKGTVIFLLGRSVQSEEDANFIASVVKEPACLSVMDCKASAESNSDLVDEVSLAYPQLVALRSMPKVLPFFKTSSRQQQLADLVARAAKSTNSALAQSAHEALVGF